MKIELDVNSLKQTSQTMTSAVHSIDQIRSSLRRSMSNLTMQSRGRGDVDGSYRYIDQRLGELEKELKQWSQFALQKGEQFTKDDASGQHIETSSGWKWIKNLGKALDFMPVIRNIKGIVEAVTGRVLETGEKLEPWERALQSLGRLGKGINEGAKLLGVADELAGGIRYVTRQAGEVIAGIPAVWENTKENIQEGLGIGWDFIQGAKGAIQEDITMGLLPDRERRMMIL